MTRLGGRAVKLWVAILVAIGAALVVGPVIGSRIHPISGAMVGTRDFHACRVEGDAFPKTVIDPSGRVRTIATAPRRIVSGYLASDEILAALVEPRRLAAVSIYADDPSTSNCRGAFPPSVGRVRGEAEEILALRPDVVFVTNWTEAGTVRLLDGAGIPLVRFTSWDSLDGVLADIRLTGAVVGAEARAEALARSVERRIAAVDERVRGRPRPRVLYYELPGYTRGAGSLIDEMIVRAGGFNVARERGLAGVAEIGFESVLALGPEVVVIPGFGPSPDVPGTLSRSAGWAGLPAVRAHRVHVVPASAITAISHHAVGGLEALAHIIHPEAFSAAGGGRPVD